MSEVSTELGAAVAEACERIRSLEAERDSLAAQRDQLAVGLNALGFRSETEAEVIPDALAFANALAAQVEHWKELQHVTNRNATDLFMGLARAKFMDLARANAERDALFAQLERARPVLEAAAALVGDWQAKRSTHGGRLTAAVDAYQSSPSEPAP